MSRVHRSPALESEKPISGVWWLWSLHLRSPYTMQNPLLADYSTQQRGNRTQSLGNRRPEDDGEKSCLFSSSASSVNCKWIVIIGICCFASHAFLFFQLEKKRVSWENAAMAGDPNFQATMLSRIDHTQHRLVSRLVLFSMSCVILFIVWPRRYEIWSDKTLIVYSILYKLTFARLQGATPNSSCTDSVKRLRWDLATDLKHRVFIKRSDATCWEIQCSPTDPERFVYAMNDISQQPNIEDPSSSLELNERPAFRLQWCPFMKSSS